MTNLVKKTIVLAQLNSPTISFHFEQINLSTEIHRILETNMMMLHERHIQVHAHLPDSLEIAADKLRFEEVITNLINNAMKYSKKDGGTLTIDAFDDVDNVTISVQDTGIGMNKEQLDRIFDEFYKADGSRHDFESSGLGLPIAKRIVEKHGGRIWVKSDGLDMGSTFYITLPKQQKNPHEPNSSVDVKRVSDDNGDHHYNITI
jgi:signal transduction histidine kinase